MTPRVFLAKGMIRLGRLLQSLALMVMKPDDCVEFGRLSYAQPDSIEGWAKTALIDGGWTPEEEDLIRGIPLRAADVLVLGVGGGRDAIPFAQAGHRVTGVDFIKSMTDKAAANARQRGLALTGVVQEISRLDFPAESFDLIFLSASMYSSVPTRSRRVAMLDRFRGILKPGGYFACQLSWKSPLRLRPEAELIKKLVAAATLGCLGYEDGDELWENVEFQHFFSSREALEAEFAAGGFEVVKLQFPEGDFRAGAVLRKPAGSVRI
jgi:SAM-dependent methyltransferase